MLRARALLKGLHSKNTFVQLVVAFGIACVYVPFMYYDPCDMLKEFAMGTVNNGTDDTSNQSDTGNKGKRAICSFFILMLLYISLTFLVCFCISWLRNAQHYDNYLTAKRRVQNTTIDILPNDQPISSIIGHKYVKVVSYGQRSCPITKLVHHTWQYRERRGRDAVGLGHKGLKVKVVLKITNKVLQRKYVEGRNKRKESVAIVSRFPDELLWKPILTLNMVNIKHETVAEPQVPVTETCLNIDPGEVYLFHGTKSTNIPKIIEQGFDITKASMGLYGKAIYMAESSEKADQYTDEQGSRRKTDLAMLLVRVNLGNIKCLRGDDRVTVRNNDGKLVCDTVIAGFNKRFREFLAYDPKNLYPEFVIIYDRTK